jgi:hypothetical protein
MGVVASRTGAQAVRWSSCLAAAGIGYTVTRRCGADDARRPDHCELSVKQEEVDQTRSAILVGKGVDTSLLW